jgi:hypothetical protein
MIDFPIEAEIEDIGAFHVSKNKEGKNHLSNNLLLQKGISILKDYFDDKEFVD